MNGSQGHRDRASHMLLGVEAEFRVIDEANDALAEVMALGFTVVAIEAIGASLSRDPHYHLTVNH